MTPAFGGQYSIQLSYGRYVCCDYPIVPCLRLARLLSLLGSVATPRLTRVVAA